VQWLALTGGLLVFLLVTFRMLAPRRAARAVRPARADGARPSVRPAPAARSEPATRSA
jgi:hypothetical protein